MLLTLQIVFLYYGFPVSETKIANPVNYPSDVLYGICSYFKRIALHPYIVITPINATTVILYASWFRSCPLPNKVNAADNTIRTACIYDSVLPTSETAPKIYKPEKIIKSILALIAMRFISFSITLFPTNVLPPTNNDLDY